MVDEEALLPLSAVSQYGYCPRRAGLLLLDQTWADNMYTAEGTGQHERVHEVGQDSRGTAVELHSVAVRSLRLGLSGSVDCLELSADPRGCSIPGRAGLWKLRPVEYKHGKVRHEREYELQLCAQALCLEEMLHCRVEEGDLFYYDDHRRLPVDFSALLRWEVEETAQRLHSLMESAIVPKAAKSRKCRECSMMDICLPQIKDRSQEHWNALRGLAAGEGADR